MVIAILDLNLQKHFEEFFQKLGKLYLLNRLTFKESKNQSLPLYICEKNIVVKFNATYRTVLIILSCVSLKNKNIKCSWSHHSAFYRSIIYTFLYLVLYYLN